MSFCLKAFFNTTRIVFSNFKSTTPKFTACQNILIISLFTFSLSHRLFTFQKPCTISRESWFWWAWSHCTHWSMAFSTSHLHFSLFSNITPLIPHLIRHHIFLSLNWIVNMSSPPTLHKTSRLATKKGRYEDTPSSMQMSTWCVHGSPLCQRTLLQQPAAPAPPLTARAMEKGYDQSIVMRALLCCPVPYLWNETMAKGAAHEENQCSCDGQQQKASSEGAIWDLGI